jgi:hypothetical protein
MRSETWLVLRDRVKLPKHTEMVTETVKVWD